MLENTIENRLVQRQQAGLLRQRNVLDEVDELRFKLNGREFINFSSNDYLGLASAHQKIEQSSGATASPLVVGRHNLHRELEQLLLEWQGAPDGYDCLLFSSGFAANTGVLQALFNERDSQARLIQDKLNHASLMDAGKHVQSLGHARQLRFAHNDLDKLDTLLQNKVETLTSSLVVTEGVFSMDGDSPDLKALSQIVKGHQSCWMLDDAHGVGIYGDNGAGSLSQQGLAVSDCDILVITFGKAIGAQGAAVIAKQSVIDYLVNFSREYIYSTHLSPLQTQAVINNIKSIKSQNWRREQLRNNIEKFRVGLQNSSYKLLNSVSPIQPLMIGDEEQALLLSERLKSKRVWASAMRYPTVAKGQARLRVTICAHHSTEDIDFLLDALLQLEQHHG